MRQFLDIEILPYKSASVVDSGFKTLRIVRLVTGESKAIFEIQDKFTLIPYTTKKTFNDAKSWAKTHDERG